jgi:hypothetical protein
MVCSTQRTPICSITLGTRSNPSHRHAAREHQNFVRVQMHTQPLAQHRFIVRQMIVRDALKSSLPQGRGDRVGVGSSDLMRGDRIARFDQFVAGGDHGNRRLTADAHARHARRGRNRNFRRMQQIAGRQQQCALSAIAGTPMHIVPQAGVP